MIWISRIAVICALLSFSFSTFSATKWSDIKVLPGVAGVGNTGDSSLLFNQARNSSIHILKSVSYDDLLNHTDNYELVDFYRSCRRSMFLGAINTEFELVESITDTESRSALARRTRNIIQISLEELDRLVEQNQLTTDLLVAVILHEVGHDCVLNRKMVDDSYDSLLNELGFTLQRAISSLAVPEVLIQSFLSRVRAQEPIQFLDMPELLRNEILNNYLDFMGDWAFNRLPHSLQVRPKSASKFEGHLGISEVPTWSGILKMEDQTVLSSFARVLLEPAFKSGLFVRKQGSAVAPLDKKLTCSSVKSILQGLVSCKLEIPISFRGIDRSRANQTFSISFDIDDFGDLAITKIEMNP